MSSSLTTRNAILYSYSLQGWSIIKTQFQSLYNCGLWSRAKARSMPGQRDPFLLLWPGSSGIPISSGISSRARGATCHLPSTCKFSLSLVCLGYTRYDSPLQLHQGCRRGSAVLTHRRRVPRFILTFARRFLFTLTLHRLCKWTISDLL